jgi:hypothetical protein
MGLILWLSIKFLTSYLDLIKPLSTDLSTDAIQTVTMTRSASRRNLAES